MSKFHLGDRVRITQENYSAYGVTGIVTDCEMEEPYPYLVEFDLYQEGIGSEDVFREQDLRPADIVPQENDAVNRPAYYTAYNGIEVIQLTEQLNFNRGNVVKYVARAGLKNPDTEIEDLKKAAWYLQREIERLEANK